MTVAVCLLVSLAAALVYCDEPRSDGYGYGHDNTVHTTHGRVQGLTENIPVDNGRHVTVDTYWGIPFARPPVGDLRFRRPVPADPWGGVFQARTPPNSCIQVPVSQAQGFFPITPAPFSEDCLHLNLWVPQCRRGSRRLATMFWIHGGSFIFGSSTETIYNGAILAASECVIVASTNYRLGAFGFLYLDTDEAPGNMGLLDMALAARWLRDNLGNFGGNPNRITIFGESSGGMSTSLFLVSPVTRGLVQNAIIQSGNPFLSIFHQSRESATAAGLELSRRLNCSSNSTAAAVDCLRQVDASALALAQLLLTGNFAYVMTAVTDGFFLTRDPIASFQAGDFRRCNILTGSNTDEGTYAMSVLRPAAYNFRSQQPLVNLTDQELEETLTQLLSLTFKPEVIRGIIDTVRDLYNYSSLQQTAPNPSFSLLKSVATDMVHACPARLLATFYANRTQKAYLYSLEHSRDNTTFPDWVGATHVSEVPFVFGTTTPDWPAFSPREVKLKQAIMHFWANFAKYGNPTPHPRDTPRWPKYSPPDPASVLRFTQSTEIRVGRTERRPCDYWNSLPREYYRP